jgi:hypothetical protein
MVQQLQQIKAERQINLQGKGAPVSLWLKDIVPESVLTLKLDITKMKVFYDTSVVLHDRHSAYTIARS